jgi:glycosyltransferase involved in cell wall biosynthesis
VHATAEEEAAVLRGLVDPSRVVTIPNGVDLTAADRARSGARAKFGIGSDVPLVAFVGRLHPIKRLDLLLDAVAVVQQRFPSTQLILAGPDEGGLSPLASRLARMGSTVHLVGALADDDKWALLREATALVMCSDSENFGTAVVEAMAAGAPVVVTKTCPWSEVAEQGCGYWVPQDPASIAEALCAIVADPVLKAAMGAQGARVARARYGWRAIGTAMAECYADVLSVRRQVA